MPLLKGADRFSPGRSGTQSSHHSAASVAGTETFCYQTHGCFQDACWHRVAAVWFRSAVERSWTGDSKNRTGRWIDDQPSISIQKLGKM